MVTSSISGEGKSTVAANLAISMARKGKRVVLVDCDLRNPTVS
ncbi:MAG: P-loop NTPase, partial [Spirochaetales bacterium]|nr:P-loop NTPase [Spirochaetales bacterium]